MLVSLNVLLILPVILKSSSRSHGSKRVDYHVHLIPIASHCFSDMHLFTLVFCYVNIVSLTMSSRV